MKYYIAKNGQPVGPFTVDELKTQGITPDTLVWNESMPQWTQAGAVSELATYILGGAQATDTLPNGGYQNCQVPPTPTPSYNNAYQQDYQQGNTMPPCPKTWLAESILVTLFCCLPFGIVGIVKASQVSSLYNAGNYDGALESAQSAAKWVKIGFFSGLAILLIYFLLIFLGTFAAAGF